MNEQQLRDLVLTALVTDPLRTHTDFSMRLLQELFVEIAKAKGLLNENTVSELGQSSD